MAESIEIEVHNTTQGYDLVRALAVRGLIGALGEPGTLVSIACRGEDTSRLLAELLPAVDAWRLDTGLAAIDVIVDGQRCTIAGDADVARCLTGQCAATEQPLVAA